VKNGVCYIGGAKNILGDNCPQTPVATCLQKMLVFVVKISYHLNRNVL